MSHILILNLVTPQTLEIWYGSNSVYCVVKCAIGVDEVWRWLPDGAL